MLNEGFLEIMEGVVKPEFGGFSEGAGRGVIRGVDKERDNRLSVLDGGFEGGVIVKTKVVAKPKN